MPPTPDLARRVATDFAGRIADRPEAVSLYVSLDDEAIVLWLETNPCVEDKETEFGLHELTAETNDQYPDVYVELRIMNPTRSTNFDPEGVLPRDAERITIREVVSDINGAEDTRPY